MSKTRRHRSKIGAKMRWGDSFKWVWFSAVGTVLVVAAILAVLITSENNDAAPLESGSPAPQFELPSAGGSQIALEDYQDEKQVLLVFYRGFF